MRKIFALAAFALALAFIMPQSIQANPQGGPRVPGPKYMYKLKALF